MGDASTPQSGPPWVKWLVIVVSAILVGSGAWYAFGYFAAKGVVDAVTNAHGGDRSTSGFPEPRDMRTEKYPSRLPIADATGDQFVGNDTMYPYKYTRQEQLDYAGAVLNADMQATAKRMRDRVGSQYSIFTSEDGKTTRRVAMPSLENTPQEIWDETTIGIFQAWEAAQNGNVNEAKKLAAVVADPEHREYSDQVKAFTNPNFFSLCPEGVAWNEQPIIANGSYEGITATAMAPLVEFNVNIGGNDSGNRVKAVLRFEQGSNRGANRWVLVTTHDV